MSGHWHLDGSKEKERAREHIQKKIEEMKSNGKYSHFILLVYHVKLFWQTDF